MDAWIDGRSTYVGERVIDGQVDAVGGGMKGMIDGRMGG